MPRIAGKMERQHQPLWDSLIRTYGVTGNIVNPATLFGAASVGQTALTNLQVAGQLASNQTFVVLSLRVWLFFDGTNKRALYLGVASQLFWTLTLGEKPQFTAPCWYLPAGGGTWGYDSGSAFYNNGVPSPESIMKLARPLVIPKGQTISVQASFYAIGTSNVLTTLNTGATDDTKVITFVADGQKTRDVQ